MLNIILDTNFLLYIVRFKIDLQSELARIIDKHFNIAILDKTMEELKGKKDSKLALIFAKQLKIIKTKDGSVDDLLLEQKNAIIATQDKELKSRLKRKGLKIVLIRQKKYLELI